ncbi:6-phosphofructokinase 1 [Lachnospiraceae bacterium KHCPX20]|nr:6-phosphofructokinase 1 [Lachnospiraceae bacterium KHCPX20]
MKNCVIIQSGGPTAAINASLAGVIDQAKKMGYDRIYGAINGIAGVLRHHLIDLTEKLDEEDFLDKLMVTPAMYLGSCRNRMPDPIAEPAQYEQMFAFFREMDIVAFFGIGGNDSMDTVAKLSAYAAKTDSPVRVMGVPKTIDNDLMQIDHTPGFGSAAKYVATSMLEMAHDTMIYPVKSITIVEIMGRDAGWLTAATALARNTYSDAPQLIYLPEVPFSITECIEDTERLLRERNSVLIAISEGIRDKEGKYISASDSAVDKFGHQQLSGAGKALEHILGQALGVKIRSVELNIPQRCGTHLASQTDLLEARALGEHAVKLVEQGKTGLMASLERIDGENYQVAYCGVPVAEVANGVRSVPRDFINERGNDVNEKMLNYLKPLIVGEPKISYVDGLPQFLDVSHLVSSVTF